VAAGRGVLAVGTASAAATIKLYDQQNLARIRTLVPFGASTAGVSVALAAGQLAVGRLSGDGQVRVYDLDRLDLTTTLSVYTTPPAARYSGGVRVAWVFNAGTSQTELAVGAGPGYFAETQFWASETWTRRTRRPVFGGNLDGVWAG
jgi:hypothetical protein